MKEGKIDIHGSARTLEAGLRNLGNPPANIGPRNVEIIRRFCNDCLLGKTVLARAKKRIGPGRVAKYLYTLKQVAFWLGVDLNQVTQAQMEDLVRRIDNDQLSYFGRQGKLRPRKYTAWSRHDIKVTIKKFYKWLKGENGEYPELVRWIDTYVEDKEIPALSFPEVKKLVSYARTARDKAIVMMLFETGARAEEFLNIRLRNLQDDGEQLVVRIEVSKTYPRTLVLYRSARFVREWLSEHPTPKEPDAQLFPVKYASLRQTLGRLSDRVLRRRVTPHILRHSCATYLAGKGVGRYQLCKWMGWAMSSDMPDRYIDRLGIVSQETITKLRQDEISQITKEKDQAQEELAQMRSAYAELTKQVQALQGRDVVVSGQRGVSTVLGLRTTC